ncbi:hypothetical protein SAMN05444394_3009 [Algoriphagus halophilus]|uniref:Uncharacterized protein n=1 Tax=Algoriphagus halophilus TaxID=226505 RepID=A0A1N6G6P5_9BACT|nr:hypothetical protein SAMN05444394_3009 [Algoriphagus halophilus]
MKNYLSGQILFQIEIIGKNHKKTDYFSAAGFLIFKFVFIDLP